MELLCIDLGSYSVKYLRGRTERKIFEVLDCNEIVLKSVLDELDDEATVLDAQIIVLKSLFEEKGPETKVIYQIPYYLSTSRYFDLPVTNKRKAEMMLPFQLEDSLPYSLSDTHFCYSLEKQKNHTSAKVHISKIAEFDSFYNLLTTNNILPAVLSTESGLIQSALELECPSGTLMILDIGHETTKSYFIYNHQLVSSHISHIAGHTINDVISKMYNIPYSDATDYKHHNCFFLTESQMEEVSAEQREFALIMKKAFEPLIAEIKRWDLGHRVKFGAHVNRLYLTGGTTKIRNFDNYLAEAVSLPIERLTHFPTMSINDQSEDDYSTYQMLKFHATSELSKVNPPNFLSGKYNSDFTQNIPIHSTAFLFTRVLILAAIVSSFLLVERFVFLNRQDKKIYKIATKALKNKQLEIDRTSQRYLKRKSYKLLSIIKKKALSIEDQVNSLKSASATDATKSFLKLNKVLTNNPNVTLSIFNSQDGEITGKFVSNKSKEIKRLKKFMEKLNFSGIKTQLNKGSKELEFFYKDDNQ